jgi:methyl-accepting chemotaxis protein
MNDTQNKILAKVTEMFQKYEQLLATEEENTNLINLATRIAENPALFIKAGNEAVSNFHDAFQIMVNPVRGSIEEIPEIQHAMFELNEKINVIENPTELASILLQSRMFKADFEAEL